MQTEKISIALVGLGRVGIKHLKAILTLNRHLDLVAIVDRKGGSAKEHLIKDFPQLQKVPFYEDLSLIPEKNFPQILAIATPSDLHFEQARYGLERNAHLLLEKPMCMDLEECQTLEKLAKEKNRHIAMGHIYRYFPFVETLKKDIKEEVFGELLHASIRACSGHDQAYYDYADWRGTWEKDGGALLNQSIHATDLMCYVLSQSPVQCRANLAQVHHSMEAEDLGYVVYTLEEGQHFDLLGTTATDPDVPYANFDMIFTKGRVQVSMVKKLVRLKVWHNDKLRSTNYYYAKAIQELWKKDDLGYGFVHHLKAIKNPHQNIYAELVQRIHNPKLQTRTSATVGKEACMNIFAAYLSAKHKGEIVNLPLDHFKTTEMEGFFENLTDEQTI